jgi:uncharacterized membrane protein YfcA
MHGIDPHYSLAGVLVGLLVGLTGVGGGSLMTPILVLAFGFHPATAVGTDLLYASATKTVGTGVHASQNSVEWPIVRRLLIGSMPMTVLTLFALSYIGSQSKLVNEIITVTLGVTLLLTAIGLFLRRRIIERFAPGFEGISEPQRTWLTILLGAVLGILVSLTSVGAGALGMIVLLVLYPKLPVSRLVGSDIAHAVPLTLLAGAGHWMMGSVNVGLLVSLLCGSVPGIIVGSLIATRVSERVLTPILATTLTIVGLKMFF